MLNDVRNVKGKDFSEIIRKNNPEKLVLLGGPPCQPFSKAGYWKTLSQRLGPDDPRNMIGAYLGIIDEIRPDGFILENVESILHPHNIQAVLVALREYPRCSNIGEALLELRVLCCAVLLCEFLQAF